MKPIHEKRKTRPYGSIGLKNGMLLAFLLMGLTSGAFHKWATLKPMFEELQISGSGRFKMAAVYCQEMLVSCCALEIRLTLG